jgi:hypothetical protein
MSPPTYPYTSIPQQSLRFLGNKACRLLKSLLSPFSRRSLKSDNFRILRLGKNRQREKFHILSSPVTGLSLIFFFLSLFPPYFFICFFILHISSLYLSFLPSYGPTFALLMRAAPLACPTRLTYEQVPLALVPIHTTSLYSSQGIDFELLRNLSCCESCRILR